MYKFLTPGFFFQLNSELRYEQLASQIEESFDLQFINDKERILLKNELSTNAITLLKIRRKLNRIIQDRNSSSQQSRNANSLNSADQDFHQKENTDKEQSQFDEEKQSNHTTAENDNTQIISEGSTKAAIGAGAMAAGRDIVISSPGIEGKEFAEALTQEVEKRTRLEHDLDSEKTRVEQLEQTTLELQQKLDSAELNYSDKKLALPETSPGQGGSRAEEATPETSNEESPQPTPLNQGDLPNNNESDARTFVRIDKSIIIDNTTNNFIQGSVNQAENMVNNHGTQNMDNRVFLESSKGGESSDDKVNLWFFEQISKIGPEVLSELPSISDDEFLSRIIKEYPAKKKMIEIKISYATNYPEEWGEKSVKQGEERAKEILDKFEDALAKISGTMTKAKGAWECKTLDVIKRESTRVNTSSRLPMDLQELIPVIRTAIWKYCDGLRQNSVFLQIGTIQDCINPLPEEKQNEINAFINAGNPYRDLK